MWKTWLPHHSCRSAARKIARGLKRAAICPNRNSHGLSPFGLKYAMKLSGLLPRFASRSSCVYICTADVDALLLAACIMDKLHLIYFCWFCSRSSRVATRLVRLKAGNTDVDALLPQACINRAASLYTHTRCGCVMCYSHGLHQNQDAFPIRIRCGCVTSGGLHPRQAAYAVNVGALPPVACIEK